MQGLVLQLYPFHSVHTYAHICGNKSCTFGKVEQELQQLLNDLIRRTVRLNSFQLISFADKLCINAATSLRNKIQSSICSIQEGGNDPGVYIAENASPPRSLPLLNAGTCTTSGQTSLRLQSWKGCPWRLAAQAEPS